jgi:hypothetical protein
MIYNTENYWAFGLFPSSGILETRKQRFGNWICSHPQVRGGKTPTQLSSLGRANFNHWTLPHLRTEIDPVFEKLCFLLSRIPDDGKSKKIQ